MAKSRAIVTLQGFTELLEEIQKAGGSIDSATEKAVIESENVIEQSLKSACSSAGVPASISGAIDKELHKNGNVYSGSVGWTLGAYDPRNPSTGYKAVFLNYGTARRMAKTGRRHLINGKWVTLHESRGAIAPRGFIEAGKRQSKAKVKAIQKQTFEEILKGLKK